MPLLDTPLFGDEASATISKNLTYSNQWGWSIARGFRSPVYQRTELQDDTRSLFAAAIAAWRSLPEPEKNRWRSRAPAPLTGYNQFIRAFMTGLTIDHFPPVRSYYSVIPLGQIEYGWDD